MEDEDWQQRVIMEKNDLAIKLDKLMLFIQSDNHNKLDTLNKNLLSMQASIMSKYINVLEQRIELF